MKLCVTFLLVLVILPSVTGEKSGERTLRGDSLVGDWGTCSDRGQECKHDYDCCDDLCCTGITCQFTYIPCK
nr:conotoxin precursor I1 [Conus judaeus]